uniref:Uncharacterized protein n=2 Tax=Caenorhabditis japonica TaxID=281687 RepID=A0A8R1ERJ5_CAEJA
MNLNNWVSAPVKAFNPEEPDPSAKETKFNLIKTIRKFVTMKRSEAPIEVLGGPKQRITSGSLMISGFNQNAS